MSRRKKLWACVPVLLVLGFVGAWAAFKPHTVTLTESQMQSRINTQLDKSFPVPGIAGAVVRNVRMKSATIHIKDGQVMTSVDVEGDTKSDKTFRFLAEAVGVPSYEAGAFYFTPERVTVSNLTYGNDSLANNIRGLADRYIDGPKARQFINDYAPGMERLAITVAQSAATHAFQRRPVYRLKDDVKGVLIRAALDEVRVEQDRIVVTFSLLQLTISVLLGLLCLVAAIAFAVFLVTHPEFAVSVASLLP